MGFILIGILTDNHLGIKSVQLYISIYMAKYFRNFYMHIMFKK